MLARALVERVERASGKIVALTSKMGSIADNGSGGSIVYRSSKAALNAAWRSLAIDWEGRVPVAMLHPGWVQTAMGGPNALISARESVAGLRQVIDALGPENSGAFLDYRGDPIPW
jgi:NAD(P)-dependent dehydrogenase (short-subunit alcohol dehydrogenase family)